MVPGRTRLGSILLLGGRPGAGPMGAGGGPAPPGGIYRGPGDRPSGSSTPLANFRSLVLPQDLRIPSWDHGSQSKMAGVGGHGPSESPAILL